MEMNGWSFRNGSSMEDHHSFIRTAKRVGIIEYAAGDERALLEIAMWCVSESWNMENRTVMVATVMRRRERREIRGESRSGGGCQSLYFCAWVLG